MPYALIMSHMCEYALITLNMIEYAGVNLKNKLLNIQDTIRYYYVLNEKETFFDSQKRKGRSLLLQVAWL